jgi:hypothetical protein
MGELVDATKVSTLFAELFSDAKEKGGRDYIYTLLRVNGIEEYDEDPLFRLHNSLKKLEGEIQDGEITAAYKLMTGSAEIFNLTVNLINCIIGKPYDPFPFHHLYCGMFPNVIKPTIKEIAKETSRIACASAMNQLSKLIMKAFPEHILDQLPLLGAISDVESLRDVFNTCKTMLATLLDKYFAELSSFREVPKLYKLPRFEIFELLVNNKEGLYGFKMHFSNGTTAQFIREADSTECVNIRVGAPLEFMVGLIDELKHEWKIGNKRLYEIGLPGRYNKLGEWKPIIYPGESKTLQKDALSMSEDPDVSGSIFYMMCTGHRVIEFIVRTSIEMPIEAFTFGKNLHFYKCPSYDDIPKTCPNVRIYDGWLELDSTDPKDIRALIAGIGVGINRMAFAYNETADWRIKYRMNASPGSCATPTKDDLQILDKYLREFPKTEDAIPLDAAIDWYNRGKLSRNVFTSYLCNYIALESVALAVVDGHADLGLDYQETRQERKQKRIRCIQEKFSEVYETEPERFVQEAYSDCIVGIARKLRQITEKVFGADHKYVKALFEDQEGLSLSNIRSKIAHGEFSLVDRDIESLVRRRLPEISEICKEFLVRVTFLLKPTERLPQWSQMFASHLSFADPRNTLLVTQESMLPTKDWRIRPEWCD